MYEIDEGTRMSLYAWIDQIPLTRRKKIFKRDFSDGVYVAEIIHHFLPKYVELHSYPFVNDVKSKVVNWNLLNRKVFKKLGFELGDDIILNLAKADETTVEYFLLMLRDKINVELMMISPRRQQTDRKDNSNQEGSTKRKSQQQGEDFISTYRYHYTPAEPGIRSITMLDLYRRDYPTAVKQKVIRTISESDSVPRLLYDQKEAESQELDKQIQDIEQKIHKLETLVQFKDRRIEYAEQSIEHLAPFVYRKAGYMQQQKYE